LRSNHGQVTYNCVTLSPSSIIWYRPGWESNRVMMESNGSLPPGLLATLCLKKRH